jgi:hypothetical protein
MKSIYFGEEEHHALLIATNAVRWQLETCFKGSQAAFLRGGICSLEEGSNHLLRVNLILCAGIGLCFAQRTFVM